MSKDQISPHEGASYRLDAPVVSQRDGVLRADDFDDLYFDVHDGLAESVQETQAALSSIQAQFTEQNNHVSDLRVKVAAIQERRENLQRSIAHHERSKSEFSEA